MAYNELIKNFERVRSYMRDFYVYGFKTRREYDHKSNRSYDNERRRMESWLGEYMRFAPAGGEKRVFLSIDSRQIRHNPLFKAWKARSFTDGDITLHFLLMDILQSPQESFTLSEIIDELDNYLCLTDNGLSFDESTIRKKLQEYVRLGLVTAQRPDRHVHYRRAPDTDISDLGNMLDYFSETAPCGVVGSFLLDRLPQHPSRFCFKHHYITQTMDSGVLASLFDAMQEKRFVTATAVGKHPNGPRKFQMVPLRIFISTQNGRQHLLAGDAGSKELRVFRVDNLAQIIPGDICPDFDALRRKLDEAQRHMWGVTVRQDGFALEHVEFDVVIGPKEGHIIQRLHREKRCGSVEMLDARHYRFTADVYDTVEMLPWIRTFIGRITRMEFSNKAAQARFEADLTAMFRSYGLEGGENA